MKLTRPDKIVDGFAASDIGQPGAETLLSTPIPERITRVAGKHPLEAQGHQPSPSTPAGAAGRHGGRPR